MSPKRLLILLLPVLVLLLLWKSYDPPVVANNSIYHDAKRPSHVLLPVVPREDAPGLKFDEK
jgi:hypothetical protein